MIRRSAGGAAALVLALAGSACAAPPQIKGTTPLGVPRGSATEVTIQGVDLAGHPRIVAPFAAEQAPPESPGGDPGQWKLRLTVAPGTPIGVYPIRVQTDDGLSNPWPFAVGQLPQVAEAEDNSTFEKAQTIPVPAVVEGQAAGNDVDYFRFAGKKGQRVAVDAQCARIGSGVDPSIRLTTAGTGRTFVASADDTPGLRTDARLTAVLPEDADYVIELSDSRYQGGVRPVYRLVVGAVPVAEEVFPIGLKRGEPAALEFRGGTLTEGNAPAASVVEAEGADVARVRATLPGDPTLDVESLPTLDVGDLPEIREPTGPAGPPARSNVPVVLNGRIDPKGDEDRFVLAVAPGQKLRIEVDAAENGSALDGVLRVLGADGAELARADDTVSEPKAKKGNKKAVGLVSLDPSLDFTVPAGLSEITLALTDLGSGGGIGFPYRITIVPIVPTFRILLNDAQVSVPRGGSAAVGVTVVRKGYTGPIALGVVNLPAGLTARPGVIAEGQEVGALTLSAASDASFPAAYLDIVGRGQAKDGPIVQSSSKAIVFAQQGEMPTHAIVQTALACAPSLPAPVTLGAPETPIEIPQGAGASIPVQASRSPGADGPLAITPLPLPPGLAVPAVSIAEKAGEGNVVVNAGLEVPLGPVTIALLAKGKFANVEQTLAVPLVTLYVVRPVALERADQGIEIRAGAASEWKGKVVRKGTFQGPVTVKLDGLPAGLKADAVTVPPDRSDFTLKVSADPTAAPGPTEARVALGYQINQKDYPNPPTPLAVKVLPEE